jgi:hypothetical protein
MYWSSSLPDKLGVQGKIKRKDGGSQMDHLLYHLAEAHKRKCERSALPNSKQQDCSSVVVNYQFVFRPGMAIIDR